VYRDPVSQEATATAAIFFYGFFSFVLLAKFTLISTWKERDNIIIAIECRLTAFPDFCHCEINPGKDPVAQLLLSEYGPCIQNENRLTLCDIIL
jgi:hypothetical protein